MKLPARVKIVEVGPRDGLQNEAQVVPTAIKIARQITVRYEVSGKALAAGGPPSISPAAY